MINEILSRNLKEVRKVKKHSMTEAGYFLGVSGNYYSSIEKGTANITLEILERALEYAGLEMLIYREA